MSCWPSMASAYCLGTPSSLVKFRVVASGNMKDRWSAYSRNFFRFWVVWPNCASGRPVVSIWRVDAYSILNPHFFSPCHWRPSRICFCRSELLTRTSGIPKYLVLLVGDNSSMGRVWELHHTAAISLINHFYSLFSASCASSGLIISETLCCHLSDNIHLKRKHDGDGEAPRNRSLTNSYQLYLVTPTRLYLLYCKTYTVCCIHSVAASVSVAAA
jgi:hypothetical protein